MVVGDSSYYYHGNPIAPPLKAAPTRNTGLVRPPLGYKMAVKMCTYQPLCLVGLRFEGYVRSHFNVGVSFEWYLILSFRTSWWQLKYFLFSPRSLGKMLQFDNHIFSNGWLNHQLENFWGGRNAGFPWYHFSGHCLKHPQIVSFKRSWHHKHPLGRHIPLLTSYFFVLWQTSTTYLSLDLMIPESTHLTKWKFHNPTTFDSCSVSR